MYATPTTSTSETCSGSSDHVVAAESATSALGCTGEVIPGGAPPETPPRFDRSAIGYERAVSWFPGPERVTALAPRDREPVLVASGRLLTGSRVSLPYAPGG